MSVEDLSLLLEIYYDGQNVSDIVSSKLYGSEFVVGYDDGLFGKISQLSNVIFHYIDKSWNPGLTDSIYEDTNFYNLISRTDLSWKEKAEMLLKERN